jgi:hypothetical protein
MNPIIYYGLQFFLGGASVVGITIIAKYIHPKFTGIVYALPVILIVAIIFVYLDQGLDISKKTLQSTFIYEFTLVYFIFAFYFLLYKTDFWSALAISFVTWLLISISIQFILRSS